MTRKMTVTPEPHLMTSCRLLPVLFLWLSAVGVSAQPAHIKPMVKAWKATGVQ